MKTLRRIFAMAMILIMVMSLGTTAFAVGPIENYYCEHATDACYKMVPDDTKCDKHVHSASCENPCTLEEGKDLICTEENHTHSETDCYAVHIHTNKCMKRGELICTMNNLPADLKTTTYAESGIDFNLYNFSQEMNLVKPVAETGNKAVYTTLSSYFNFGGHGSDGSLKYIKGTESIGQLDKGHFTYEKNLGPDGAPIITFDSVNKNPELESDEARSIGYVFGKKEHFAVTAYENIKNTPLTYNSETGYYEYDSSSNAVDFDEENNLVHVRGYKDQGKASADSNGSFAADDGIADFFPFNSRIKTGADGKTVFIQDNEKYKAADGTYYYFDNNQKDAGLGHPDYWFGASMKAVFYYPQDGVWMNSPMKYEFSGDDDAMVYIDNIFVMDLGGAHSRASGEINFATGLVETWLDAGNQPKLCIPGVPYDHRDWAADAKAAGTLYQDGDGSYRDSRGTVDKTQNNRIRYYPTTIYECYKAAYEEQGLDAEAVAAKLAEVFVKIEGETVVDAYGNEHDVYRFHDYSAHTFDWFYLERHSFEANFYTKFNLPTIPQNSLTIEKEVEDGNNLVDDDALYAFEVWATDKDGKETVKIDTVKVKSGESAVINNMIENTKADDEDDHFGFIVKELGQVKTVDGVETYSLEGYSTTWIGGGFDGEGVVTRELSAETSQVVKFTNTVNAPAPKPGTDPSTDDDAIIKDVPKTEDTTEMSKWLTASMISVVALVILFVAALNERKREEEK